MQSRSQRTRRALVDAARLEFDERGYAPTTAKSIADRARCGTGTFYHYFPDKDAVLREITLERVTYLMNEAARLDEGPATGSTHEDLEADARRRLRALVRLYVDYHRSDRGLHAVITERRLCDAELDGIMTRSERAAYARLAATLRQWGYDGDADATAFMVFSLLEGAVHAHVLGEPLVSDDRFEAGLVEAMLRVAAPSTHTRLPAQAAQKGTP